MCEKNHQSFSAFSHINNARSLGVDKETWGKKNSYNFSICQAAYEVEQLPRPQFHFHKFKQAGEKASPQTWRGC